MQPETKPEDIHTILSRFNHWADHPNANGHGHAKTPKGLDAEVREIPYEEAMRMMRSRRGGVARAAAARPASDVPRPVAAEEAAPAAEPIRTVEMSKVRNAEKSMRRALGRAPAAKKAEAKAAAAAPQPKQKDRKPERKTQAAPSQEFRQVLAKTVRKAKPVARPAARKEKGRDQRVSVRLSRAEEQRLQVCAAKAGVTMSEYLRMRALEGAATPPGEARHVAAHAIHETAAAGAAAAPARPAKSGLADWLALLRNRFLASPGRFAERA